MIIKNTKDKKARLVNAVVYGPYKVGKTKLLGELIENKQKVFCAAVESGTLCLAGYDLDYVDCADYGKVLEVLDYLEKNQDKYDWVAFDTITEFGQNLWPSIRERYQKKALKEDKKPGAFNQQAWGEFGETIGSIVKRIRALDCNTVIYAHPIEKEQEDGKIMKSPDIYGKSANRIVGWLDEVYYMFMDKDGERKFLTEQTERTIAGSRFGKLEQLEPASLWNIQQKVMDA
jgi:hypothetical protein